MAEAIVTLPDGRRAKLTGPTREAVEAKARELVDSQPEAPQAPGGGETFRRSILEGVLGNVAGIPQLALEGSGLFGRTPSLLGIEDPTDVNLPKVPAPSGQQALSGILAGGRSLGELVQGQSPDIAGHFQGSMANSVAGREANPFAAAGGDALADAFSILAGRAPFVKAPAQPAKAVKELAPGFKKFAQNVWESPAVQKLARGVGRAGEAGFEGAALAALKDGDPLETAAYSAGGQAAGSMALQLADFGGVTDIVKGDFWKGAGKLTVAAILAGSAIQYMESAIPGVGDEWLTKNLEDGYDKVLLAMLGGALAGAAGAGRVKGENLPLLADAITAIPRGTMISLWEDLARSDDAKKGMDLLAKHPKAHTEAQIKALERGIFEKGESFSGQVARLLEEDEKYREMWNAPDPRLVGVPVREED